MTVVTAAAAAALFGCGTYLLLQRQLTRIVIGLALLAHGANLLIVMSRGGPANATFVGSSEESSLLDPLPQAFVLTAIVIAFGTTSLLLAMAYRSWVMTHDDEVEDDIEDRLVALRHEAREVDALAAAEADVVDYETLEDDGHEDGNGNREGSREPVDPEQAPAPTGKDSG
jgi:multicomponent Na+:H+ antiporter subunit C